MAWRDEHNSGLIDALIAEGKPGNSSATAIRSRMRRERLARQLGRGGRRITEKGSKQGIFKAESIDSDGSIVEHHTQAEMIDAMRASNLSCQQQCLGTPFMSAPFTDDFGYLADTSAARDVISGSYNHSPQMDPYLVELLNVMAMPTSI